MASSILADPNGLNSGEAYVFSGCDGGVESYGSGCPGTGGLIPALDLLGCPAAGQTVTLTVTNGLGGVNALLFLGAGKAQVSMGGGCDFLLASFLPGGVPIVLSGSGAGDGELSFTTLMPNLGPVAFNMQALVQDPGSVTGHTNGIEVTVE